MKTYYKALTVIFTIWFLASVIFADNINELKDDCFIYLLSLCFIEIGVFLNKREDESNNNQ